MASSIEIGSLIDRDPKIRGGRPKTAGTGLTVSRIAGWYKLHWHPNADEWQYYISGKGRMTVFAAASTARTMDFEEGDVGYVPISHPHYVENTGDSDLVFLEMFKTGEYQDISLAEWMAHTPHLLMNQHLAVGTEMLNGIRKDETVITPV